jgi:hypothetical protein
MSIRRAQSSDMDAITWISAAATPAAPVCRYRYPLREKYPEDFERFSKIRPGEYLANTQTGASDFAVYEVPGIEDASVMKVVAYAIWD